MPREMSAARDSRLVGYRRCRDSKSRIASSTFLSRRARAASAKRSAADGVALPDGFVGAAARRAMGGGGGSTSEASSTVIAGGATGGETAGGGGEERRRSGAGVGG